MVLYSPFLTQYGTYLQYTLDIWNDFEQLLTPVYFGHALMT